MTFTATTLSGQPAKPSEQVVIKKDGQYVGMGIKQGDGSVNAGSTIYRPTSG